MEKKDGSINILAELTPKIDIADSILSLFIDRDTGEQVYRFSSDERTGSPLNLKKNKKVKINLEIQDIFPNGVFTLRASVKSRDRTKEYALWGDLASFEIDRRASTGSEWDIHWQPNEKFIVE
jgi:ABC-2 type transport system ATP-binding protein